MRRPFRPKEARVRWERDVEAHMLTYRRQQVTDNFHSLLRLGAEMFVAFQVLARVDFRVFQTRSHMAHISC